MGRFRIVVFTWILIGCMWFGNVFVWASGSEVSGLHAKAAVLMDGKSGRVLYGRDGDVELPMASTTKVMTCIVALENCELRKKVAVSVNAAAQPKVRLGMTVGDEFYMKDLLYALLLKCYNDAAVVIAEGVAGSVEEFAGMMNEKAREIGCERTHFITPNGLDGEDEEGIHRTTARELCLIMRYAIKNPVYCQISQTKTYGFSNASGTKSYELSNGNALLSMMDGVIAGKTGFTGQAGYCYVCAVEQGQNLYIISLLACGWPNHKTYKWADVKKLITYGKKNYVYKRIEKIPKIPDVKVVNGIKSKSSCEILGFQPMEVLVRKNENVSYQLEMKKELNAPIQARETIGTITYLVNEDKLGSFPIIVNESIEEWTYQWCWNQVCRLCFE